MQQVFNPVHAAGEETRGSEGCENLASRVADEGAECCSSEE